MSTVLRTRFGISADRIGPPHRSFADRYVCRVTSEDGAYAVKVDPTPSGSHRDCIGTQAHVHRTLPGVAPAAFQTVDGLCCAHTDLGRVRVSRWVDGTTPPDTVAIWSGLGTLLGRLHCLPSPTESFRVSPLAAADEIDVLARTLDLSDLHAIAGRVRAAGLDADRFVTVHGEVNTANCVRAATGDLTLVDWDQAGAGSAVLDLGYPLVCVFAGEGADARWDTDLITAFYGSYRRERALPAADRIVTAALLHAARYVPYGDTAARQERLQAAVDRADNLTAAVEAAAFPT